MAGVRKRSLNSAFANPAEDDVDYGKELKICTYRAPGESDSADCAEEQKSEKDGLISHWLCIRKKADSSDNAPKKAVRRVLNYLKTQIPMFPTRTPQSGIVPLDIVPAEMWSEILSYIQEPDDLINCSATCTLFKTILEERKIKKLFGLALPFIAKYVEHNDILKCRLVCREWEAGVRAFAHTDELADPPNVTECRDSVVGNYFQHLKNMQRSVYGVFGTAYEFTIPFTPDDENQYEETCDSVREEMKAHPRNPFVDGQVFVYLEYLHENGGPSLCTEMKYFLKDFGLHLTCLNLDSGGSYKPVTYKDMCSLVTTIFKECPKLRWFEMGGFTRLLEENIDSAVAEMNTLPDHSCIKFVNISDQNCIDILRLLFIKYSNQLVSFHATDWNANLGLSVPWENLTQVCLRVDMFQEITTGLRRLNAPRLRQMDVSFTRNRTTLRNILEALNSFPRLTSLEIRLNTGKESAPGPAEILSEPADIICRSSITSLQLTFDDGFTSFDFLVCFPLVKKLHLQSYFKINKLNKEMRKAVDLLMQDDSGTYSESRKRLLRLARQKDDLGYLFGRIVHVNQYLVKILVDKKKDAETDVCMYQSNIWEILLHLRTLSVYVYRGGVSTCSKVFTRSGYLDSGFDKLPKQVFGLVK